MAVRAESYRAFSFPLSFSRVRALFRAAPVGDSCSRTGTRYGVPGTIRLDEVLCDPEVLLRFIETVWKRGLPTLVGCPGGAGRGKLYVSVWAIGDR